MNRALLAQLASAWRGHLWLRSIVLAAVGADVAFLLAGPAWASAAFLVVLGLLLARSRPWRVTAPSLAAHLDRTIPSLEESASLWLREPAGLTALERLQLARIEAAFAQADRSRLQPGTRALVPILLLALALPLVLAGLHFTPRLQRSAPSAAAVLQDEASVSRADPARVLTLREAELLITPPAYTGRPARTVSGLEAEIEAGSDVEWRILFSHPVRDGHIALNAGGKIPFLPPDPAPDSRRVSARAVIQELAVYALVTFDVPLTPPATHVIRVIPDRPPAIVISAPAQVRTELAAPAPILIEVQVSDDYGVAGAWLVGTVAKGSGESVKFREQKFALTAREEGGVVRRFEATLDLAALGVGPGDELYFHVEALDQRTPAPNLARSETRFVMVKGPQAGAANSGRGLAGVNRIPEYFRSQRQLIIDTEKLLADRPSLTERAFRERSNDLGIDQQLLRLRYGRFLGEESSSEIAPSAGSLKTNAAGIPDALMHQHDSGHDHAHPGAGGAPAAAEAGPKDAKEILAPFVHQHDSQEVATFMDGQTKGTLRDVLSAMWESEGFLRVAQPAESLPAQHRALAILKYLQQGDRAYVQRVGFEPAPLKLEERRLQGDISTVPRVGRIPPPERAPDEARRAVREALRVVNFAGSGGALTALEREALREVEPFVARAAAEGSEPALAGLPPLRLALAGNGATDRATLRLVERSLWKMLPTAEAAPTRAPEAAPALAEKYFEALGREGAIR